MPIPTLSLHFWFLRQHLQFFEMLNLANAKLTGTPGTSGWVQVHEFESEDPEKSSARGRLFAVIATKRMEEGVGTVVAGRELLSRLHEEYFGDLNLKPFNALESATKKVIAEFAQTWGDVEIAAAAVVGDVVYSAAGGGSEVSVYRDGALGTILKSSGGDVISASGYPKEGDVILLATKTFYDKITQGVIKAALGSESPEIAAESLAPSVHKEEEAGRIGAVIIRFSRGTEAPVAGPLAPSPHMPQPLEFPGKILQTLGSFVGKFKPRNIYLKSEGQDEEYSQNKKLTFSVALILLVILAISIGFGIRQKKINDVKKKYQGILSTAQQSLDEAISLASVSPDRSRELFRESEDKLGQVTALNVKDPKVDELGKKIENSRALVLGEISAHPELFLDLTLLSSGFKGDVVSSSGGNIFVLDKSGKRIVSIETSTKKSKVVAGPGVIDEAFDMASYEDRVFVLASDGVYELDKGKTKILDKDWAGDALIHAFAGNLYVLDKNGNAIFRYAGSGTSFGTKQNWLAGSTRASFSDAEDWTIDGSVYVLFAGSKVLKYSLGSPQGFSVSGAFPDVGKIDDIYADPDNQNVYLLDRSGKRIVVTDKKGKYVAQYGSGDVGNVTKIVVSETDKKAILLTGDKILSIELRHL